MPRPLRKASLALLLAVGSCAGGEIGSPAPPPAPVPAASAPSGQAGGVFGPSAAGPLAPPPLDTPAFPVPNRSPGVVPAPSAGTPPLPAPGTAVFGPRGLFGVVAGQSGGTAIVNPVGGGPPGMFVPNGNGTATIFQPGGPPITIVNPSR